jgi:anti-sigma-K factor RskA
LYALGLLEEPDRAELRAHLERSCDVCTGEVRRAAVRVSALAALAPVAEPPEDLRKRVLASVGIHPQFKWNWMQTWATLVACAVLAVFWLDHLRRERVRNVAFTDAMEQVKVADAERVRLKDVMSLMNAPDTIVRVSSDGQPKPPQAKVFFNRNRGVLLLASNLPPAPAGKRYEMWVIPTSGKPLPAGLFQTESNGTAAHLREGPLDLDATAAVAVTLEDEAGAPQPTSKPILVAKR